MKKILVVILLLLNYFLIAQDSLKVMHYNLLYYGTFTDYCNLNNNDPQLKTDALKTIVDYYLPDILTVNEIGPSSYYQDKILNEVMNAQGRDYFARALETNFAGSEIVNMLYYNTDKLGLASQDVIASYLRDINVYKLFYQHAGLATGQDTTFLFVISAHFKAGSSGSDKETRAQMAASIVDYLTARDIDDACLMTGDLNLQNNVEQAWQNLTADYPSNFHFTDPTNREGIWHNNQAFTDVHTQSTHVSSNGCASTGGMDDRFDFILTNETLHQEESLLKYVPESYRIPGQDGQRLNGSLIDPPNNSAPSQLIDALYTLSDHLPVMVDLQVDIQNSELPASWQFSTSMSSHIISIPLTCAPKLNGSALSAGSYIGAFCVDNGTETCVGHVLWNGSEDIALVAYGDDPLSPEKDGLSEGEPIIFKVFSITEYADYYADVDFDPVWPDQSGLFVSGGISALVSLEAFYLQSHVVAIPVGWSSLSSFLIPKWKSIEDVFGDELSKVIYLRDDERIYYPEGAINELLIWENNAAFAIKTSEAFLLDVEGLPEKNLTMNLRAGWNLVPVPVPCFVSVLDMETVPEGKIRVIQSLAGTDVYWPEKNINTLHQLEPGQAYLLNVSEDCTLSFDFCN